MARQLQATRVMHTHIANPIEVPEDVRAEEALQPSASAPQLPPVDAVPEDMRSELDREARLAEAEMQQHLSEGRPPAASDDVAV